MDHMTEQEFSSVTTLQPAHGGGQTGGCGGQDGGVWPQPQLAWLEQLHVGRCGGGGGGGGGGGCCFSQHWHCW